MNICEAIKFASQELQPELSDIDAKVDAEFLLSKAIEKNFTWLKTWPEYQLTETQQNTYIEMLKRRKRGEPIAYITGERGFWTLNLKTNASTLIPRPETELLVELALAFLSPKKSAKVLDLGTGTGAIALAIASERPADSLIACDYSQAAVELARVNAAQNNIDNVDVVQSDWFAQISGDKFDLIVSNPPYIEAGDPHLTQGDLIYEPNSALIADDCGLADIKIIIAQSKKFLCQGGGLMIEHGYNQGEAVRKLFQLSEYQQIDTIKDLAGLERITMAKMPG